jgi:5-methylcytosine-specific restriction endonuclease McrA
VRHVARVAGMPGGWRVKPRDGRDGNRCRGCGASKALAVHHVVSLADGGEKYALNNLITLCRDCHDAQHRGDRGSTGREAALPRANDSGEIPHYDEVPFV